MELKDVKEMKSVEQIKISNQAAVREDFSCLNFYHCDLDTVSFNNCCFQNTSFFSGNLVNCTFNFSVLSSVQMNCLDVVRGQFVNCDLSGCNFFKSDLSYANFENAEFEGCNFWDTDLSHVNFCGADLSQVSLANVKSLVGAVFNSKTKLPFTRAEAFKRGMKLSQDKTVQLFSQSPERPGKVLEFRVSNALPTNVIQLKSTRKD